MKNLSLGTPDPQRQSLAHEIISQTPSTNDQNFQSLLVGETLPEWIEAEKMLIEHNITMHTRKAAGPMIQIEEEILKKMRDLIGFHDGDGVFTPGGSLGNIQAMILARNAKLPTTNTQGLATTQLTGYISEESHYSIPKAAAIAGIGSQNIRTIPTNTRGQIDTKILEQKILADIDAGFIPFIIIGTSGTTVLGAFDDLQTLATLSQKYKTRFHVDGSRGMSAILSDTHRHCVDGVQHADSVTRTPHKTLGASLTCSTLLTRDRHALQRSFDFTASYLSQESDTTDPGQKTIQCGRRNESFKLRAIRKKHGDLSLGTRIQKMIDLTHFAAQKVKNDPDLELLLEPNFLSLCFKIKNTDHAALCDFLNKSGKLKISYAHRHQHTFIRMICNHPEKWEKNIIAILDLLKSESKKFRSPRQCEKLESKTLLEKKE